jgi:hypothetical protein
MDCYFPYQETGREIRAQQQLKLFLLDHPLYSLNEFCIFEEYNRTKNE